jgi:hypothetical protein
MHRAMEQVALRTGDCGPTMGTSALTAQSTAEGVEGVEAVGDPLAAEAEFILSALEAGGHCRPGIGSRRHLRRQPYRSVVHLRLFSDSVPSRPWVLYARDANRKALGFITRHRLPLGYGGTLAVRGPLGQTVHADCTVHRCRETVSGWFEGCLTFNRAQWCLEGD